ncbi:MAG: ATP-binding protein [Bacteroidota bacterium]
MHEFKTPLTIINGIADKIVQPPKAKDLIKRNSRSLINLVNQILDLRQLELGRLKIDYIQGDVVQYLRYLNSSFEAMAELKGLQLHFISEESKLLMDFDQDKLMRIVSNLISNAIKYTPRVGDVYFILYKSKMGPNTQAFSIKVKDTGIGISEEQQANIFERFYRVEDKKQTYAVKSISSGIGLSFTKELVSMMGGSISVESALDKGSTFVVQLPVKNEARLVDMDFQDLASIHPLSSPSLTTPSESISNGTSANAAKDRTKSSILIIEDSQDLRQYLASFLESDYQLYMAKDGQEGIEMAYEHIPDLIISDVMMPEKDGFEVCDILKGDARTSHIPIVLLTAKSSVEARIEGFARGADAYLPKPFNEKELSVRLEKLLTLRQQLQQRYQNIKVLPEPASNSTSANFNREDEFITQLQQTIEENLSNANFGPTELCRAIGMSRSQLHLKIKALTNKSTSIYIRSVRLHRAKELLQRGDLNVTQVAFEVGFNNVSYFSKKFTEEFNVNPLKVYRS